MGNSLSNLIQQIKEEALREEFPIDSEVYEACGFDPHDPVLFGGNIESNICFFARDLGRDEVKAQQPLIGAAGRMVRGGVFQFLHGKKAENKENYDEAAQKILLTNTVPYKPPGNKAYPQKVIKRFRPFMDELLKSHWGGKWIIPLGAEALKWFIPYDKDRMKEFTQRGDKFESTIEIVIDEQKERSVTIAPLPHPSPLNQKYYQKFPEMLQLRLQQYQDRYNDFE